MRRGLSGGFATTSLPAFPEVATILSDLLGATVRTQSGQRIGYVTDARLVLDQAPAGPDAALAGARLHGLIVCPRHAGSFLGYERTGVRSPAVIAWWLRYRYRGSFLLHWTDVLAVPRPEDADQAGTERVVLVHDDFTEYNPALSARLQ